MTLLLLMCSSSTRS